MAGVAWWPARREYSVFFWLNLSVKTCWRLFSGSSPAVALIWKRAGRRLHFWSSISRQVLRRVPPESLDPGPATVFQRRVWEQTALIPFGQVRTYAWIAGQLGCRGGARAVGTALGRNPLPLIVPCHRVVCSNGHPGGFSATGGPALKRLLLEHEGVAFNSQGRVLARQAVEK